GASGYLRQEFRELELLNEITKLSYEGALPEHINGNLRNAHIRQFQHYKGTEFVPSDVPSQLKWTSSDPMDLLPCVTDSPWQIVQDNKKKHKSGVDSEVKPKNKQDLNTHAFVVAKGTVPIPNADQIVGTKRKTMDGDLVSGPLKKKKAKLEPAANCVQCQSSQKILHQFTVAPEMLMFSLNVTGIAISKTVRVKSTNNKDSMLPLKGVVYSGEFHFTSQIISDKNVWYHDGMTTKSKCWDEGNAASFSEKTYMSCNNKNAVLAIYVKK
ncbi:hypothetical protein L208DRAFT_1559972, partial [Tricholoma matsutake]